jgi:hypothetical protein
MKITGWLFCLLWIIRASFLQAQIAGNPVETKGEGEWTISAAGSYVNMGLSQEKVSSHRILVKSGWGVADRVDIYGLIGMVQLNMGINRENVSDYKGKYTFAYGLGLNVILKPVTDYNRMGIWCGAQTLRFPSSGKFIETSQLTTNEYEMKYDWKELHVYFGVVYPYQHYRFYAAAAGYLIYRNDTKKEYLVYGDERTYWGEVEDGYRSGLWTGGILGIEINLANRFVFSIEGLVYNTQNYEIKIGICQTGMEKW